MPIQVNNDSQSHGQSGVCSQCGHLLPNGTPAVDCPVCLMGVGLGKGGAIGAPIALGNLEEGNKWFGDYELVDQIGIGGMGVVFRAWHRVLNYEVGLKLLHRSYCANEKLAERFTREIQALSRMNHEHIVHIREHGKVGDRLYFTMDWIDGHDLGRELRELKGPMDPRRVARIMRDMALAVDHAHYQGVLHRDLKPENIILDREDKPWLTDFGVARFLDDGNTGISVEGQVIGNLRYLAPEQAATGHGVVERTTDVYGLGAVCFHLLTGRPPFDGSATQILRDITERVPLAPGSFVSGIHPDLDSSCLKCMQKDPRHRYSSAAAFASDLDCFLNGRPVVARPLNVVQRTWRWCQRRPMVASLMGGCLLSAC